MSVSDDHAFPLFQQAYSGNTADVKTYVRQWFNLIDLPGKTDFLYVADCKLICAENIAAIADNGGYFLAPAPMYDSFATVFETALARHAHEVLIPYKGAFKRGFEVPITVSHQDKDYRLRMIIIFDQAVARVKRQNLQERITKTRQTFEKLIGKLDTGKIKYRGRPSPNKAVEKLAMHSDRFDVRLDFDAPAFDAALKRCGYYPLLTNQCAELLSIEQAMAHHKGQYKNEHTFRRAKGPYDLEPIYLHHGKRIKAYLFLFIIALQIVVLLERTAQNNIRQLDRGLDDFMPNRKDVRNPKAEYLLAAFQYMVKELKDRCPLPTAPPAALSPN